MKNNIRQDVIAWNNRFPLDRWYRNKYKTPFLSAIHREFTFYGQYLEYYEDKMIKEHFENQKVENAYYPMENNWWSGSKSSKQEIDDWFNSLL